MFHVHVLELVFLTSFKTHGQVVRVEKYLVDDILEHVQMFVTSENGKAKIDFMMEEFTCFVRKLEEVKSVLDEKYC